MGSPARFGVAPDQVLAQHIHHLRSVEKALVRNTSALMATLPQWWDMGELRAHWKTDEVGVRGLLSQHRVELVRVARRQCVHVDDVLAIDDAIRESHRQQVAAKLLGSALLDSAKDS